jgi:hypothetical protein
MSVIGQSFTLASLATILINFVLGQSEGYDWCFRLFAMLTAVSLALTLTSPQRFPDRK